MTVSFPFTRGRLILAPVRLAHGAEWRRPTMALDTGARRTVVTPALADELGFDPDALEATTQIVSATGPASAGFITLDSVSVLGLRVTGLRVVCFPLARALGIEGVLGLDFLNRFRVVIDGPTETVTIGERSE